jgi:hypothetical protein
VACAAIEPEQVVSKVGVFSAASAHWVLGDNIGDPTADEIWALAR